jgi:hypothetical protein
MQTKSRVSRTSTRVVFGVLGIMVLLAGKELVSSFAAGCGTAQFDGNATSATAGIAPRSIVTLDLNHDGKNDLAVANYGSGQGASDGSISILLNNGSGGFSSAPNVAAGINPRSIVSADFNNDTHPDLAVVNNVTGSCCVSSFVTILTGNGTGNFSAGTPVAVGNDSDALATGDFNGDGKADLAATTLSSSGGVSVLLGDGAGGLAPAQIFTVGGNLRSIAAGDVNGDGKVDLLTGNLFGPNVGILIGNGSGSFAAVVNANTGATAVKSVAIGDFNQDTRTDIAVATSANTVAVVLANVDGSFGSPTSFAVDSSPQSVLAKDLNGDGKLDLVTANVGAGNASVLLGNGLGSFAPKKSYVTGLGAFFVASSDLNGDSKLDLAVPNAGSNNVSILPGDGSGGFAGARSFGVGLTPTSIAGGDFNRDGKVDLAVTNSNQNSVSVLLGNNTGSFGADVKYPAGSIPRDVVVADFNDDADLDLAVANSVPNTNGVSILLGNPTGVFGAPTTFTSGTSTYAITSADFNKDGNVDLAVVNNGDSNVSVLLGAGNGSFGAPANISVATSPIDLAAADLNGDGNADLIVASSIGPLSILLGDGAGGMSPGNSVVLPGPISVAVGDVNGDGLTDVATANSDSSLSVLLGNASAGFGAPATIPLASPSSVAFADVNGDGKTDLTASSGPDRVVALLGDGAGAFSAAVPFSAGSSPTGILPIDLNRDQRTDLVVASSSSSVSVLMNTCAADPVVPPGLSVSDAIVAEGNSGQTNLEFEISLPVSSDQTVSVSYYSKNESATGGVDYQSVSGRVTFPPGVTERIIVVPINGDTLTEPEERFNVSLFHPLNAVLSQPNGLGIITNDDGPAVVGFHAASYTTPEFVGSAGILVVRSVNLSIPFSVAYATSDVAGSNNCNVNNGAASSRCDYLTTIGTLHFAANETTKIISVPIIDDSYAEGIANERFSITLSDPSGATFGANSTILVVIDDNDPPSVDNPIGLSNFFVRQHYVDFLNREPDLGGSFFWTDQIENCTPKPQCTEIKRINVSAAFFLSIEFQETGYLVYRFYKSAYGNIPGAPVPVRLIEFLPDTQQIGKGVIVGQPGADQLLEDNKVAYALDFVSRSRFTTAYPTTLMPAQFVDALFTNAGVTPLTSDRDAAINEFGGAGSTSETAARARVLRRVAENSTLKQQETNKAFVLMQYFGYLRRNPNDAPDTDYSGYNFWLGKLNQFNGNFVNAEMVKAFLVSGEYRQRFGP